MTDPTADTAPIVHVIEWPCYGDMDCHCCDDCTAKIEAQELELELEREVSA